MFKKSIYIIFSIYFLVPNVLAEVEEKWSYSEMYSTLQGFGQNCDPKPTNDTIKNLLMHVQEVDEDTKCFRRCLMQLFDLYETETSNQLKVEIAMELSTIMYPDKKKDFEELIKICNERTLKIENRCHVAHEHFLCTFEQMKLRNLKLIELEQD